MTQPHDYLLESAARGLEANFGDFADGPDRTVEAEWIRNLLLGNTPSIEGHASVALGSRTLRIRGAHVRGTLDLRRCGSAHQPLPSLCLRHCRFERSAHEPTSIDVSDAHLGGLELADSRLTHLRGVGVRIDGSVDISRIRPLDEGRDALCWAKLSRAFLGGHVLVDDVTLRAPATVDGEDQYDFFELNWALNLFMTRVAGSVMMRRSPTIDGGLMLDSAHVLGDVLIDSATIRPRRRAFAMALERATIDGNLRIARLPTGGLRCEGPIWMHRATIGGSFDLAGGNLTHTDARDGTDLAIALYAGRVTVRGGVTLENVTADGLICLQGLQSDGILRIQNVRLTGALSLPRWFPPPAWKEGRFALDVRGARVATKLRLNGNVFSGRVDLSHAQCGALDVDLTGIDAATPIVNDGLTYANVESGWFTEGGRFDEWLPREGIDYRPQPYVQLADVLASHGQESDALDVLLSKAKRDARRHWYASRDDNRRASNEAGGAGARRSLRRRCVTMFRACVYALVILPYSLFFDFGLSPVKAGFTLVGSVLFGVVMFGWMDHQGAMVVSQTPVASYVQSDGRFVAGRTDATNLASVPCGDAIRLPVYAADVFIPLVDLREEVKCEIDAVSDPTRFRPFPWEVTLYRSLKAAYAIAGWIVTTLALLTFSGVTRHRLSQA